MVLVFLIIAIAMIPLIVGFGLYYTYGKSPLIHSIFLLMFLLTVWQLDIAILYSYSFLSEEVIFFFFRLFRFGLLFGIPTIFLIAYVSVREDDKQHNVKRGKRNIKKKSIYFLYVWSFILYFILWTELGVEGLMKGNANDLTSNMYYPIYGKWNFLFVGHTFLYLIGVILAFRGIRKIKNKDIKEFIRFFMFSTIGLYFTAILNVLPDSSLLTSSIGMIIFSLLISTRFIKMYNNILHNYNEVIEKQNKLDYAGNITSSLIHEVKNGLGVIDGYSTLLPRIHDLNDETKEIMSEIKKASVHINQFVKSYQEFLKSEKLTFEDVSIKKAINYALSISNPYLISNDFKVKLDISEDITVYMNKIYFSQVVVNLIKNSVEETPNEQVRKEININVYCQSEHLIIDFKDKGKGIHKRRWEEVFLPYNTDKKEGMGLGLPFCKQVIFAHRGDINIMSSDENGTWFQITLPIFKFSEYIKNHPL